MLGTYASYEIADYVGDPQVDQRVKAGLTADYYFNPVVSVYGRYEHTDFTSTVRERFHRGRGEVRPHAQTVIAASRRRLTAVS
ncbi:MAG: outer membrane beta-barrel protein [Methyloceanibacter sp.]